MTERLAAAFARAPSFAETPHGGVSIDDGRFVVFGDHTRAFLSQTAADRGERFAPQSPAGALDVLRRARAESGAVAVSARLLCVVAR